MQNFLSGNTAQPVRRTDKQRWALDWIRTTANLVEFGLDPGC